MYISMRWMGGWGGCLGGGQGSELAAAAGGGRRHCWVYYLVIDYLSTVDYLCTVDYRDWCVGAIDACLRSPTCDMRHATCKRETHAHRASMGIEGGLGMGYHCKKGKLSIGTYCLLLAAARPRRGPCKPTCTCATRGRRALRLEMLLEFPSLHYTSTVDRKQASSCLHGWIDCTKMLPTLD
jgi:hypothetical protein